MRPMPAIRVPIRRAACRAALLLLIVLAPSAGAVPEAGIAIIVHPGDAHGPLGRGELASIFRRTLRVDSRGQLLVPVNLAGQHPLRRAFSRAVFGGTPEDMEAYWNERYFHGVSPPTVVASVEAMLRFVAVTPGAVGYVPACTVDARVIQVALLADNEKRDASECASP